MTRAGGLLLGLLPGDKCDGNLSMSSRSISAVARITTLRRTTFSTTRMPRYGRDYAPWTRARDAWTGRMREAR